MAIVAVGAGGDDGTGGGTVVQRSRTWTRSWCRTLTSVAATRKSTTPLCVEVPPSLCCWDCMLKIFPKNTSWAGSRLAHKRKEHDIGATSPAKASKEEMLRGLMGSLRSTLPGAPHSWTGCTRAVDLLGVYRERGRGVGHGLAAHGGRHDGERRLRTNCLGLRGIGRVGSAPGGIVLHRRW